MPHTRNSIIINADIDKVFDITNDIERWPELFNEYADAKILRMEENKITFQLTNNEGKSWRSSRIVNKQDYICTAEREEPKFPFKFMHLKWTYKKVDSGVDMTWEQDFEMDEKAKYNNEQAEELINKHSQENMKKIKGIIEAGG